ncbi:MAG: hypothetical protein LUO85_01965 [Methanomassiliicoccales archaeon]|nr:hypothetical protein [Methanomassiliicoccales archaeon]
MRTVIKSLAVVAVSLLMLSVLTTVAMAAGGANQSPGNNEMMSMSGKHGGDSSGLMSQSGGAMLNQTQEKARMTQMMGESARLGLFGGFDQNGSIYEGRFVSFGINQSSGSIDNYTVATTNGDVVVFKAIGLLDLVPGNISLMGSLFVEQDSNSTIVVHDNPVVLLHMTSNQSHERMNFSLGPRVSSVVLPRMANDTNDTFALISGAGIQGILKAENGTLSIESDGQGNFSIVANASDVMFRMKPSFAKGHMALDDAVQDAIASGKVAGELSLTVRNGSAMFDLMRYRMSFTFDLQEAAQNHLRLAVSSTEHEGRVAIINLDQSTFDTLKGNDVTVTLDGRAIRQTQDPLDVLSASGSQDSDAIFCVESTANGSQMMVYIPSFSTHVLDLSSASPLASVLSLAGLLAVIGAMAAVGVAAFLLLRRKG